MVTALILAEMAALQRASITGANITLIPAVNATAPFTASPRDSTLNSLWLLSLVLTLTSALLAGLVKQWLHYYVAEVTGTPKERATTRHFRYLGLNKWHVPLIIELLPVVMNVSLILFFIGLIFYTQDLSGAEWIRVVIIILTSSVFVIYIGTSFIPLVKPQCPYKTSLSRVYNVLPSLVSALVSWRIGSYNIPSILVQLSSPRQAEKVAIADLGSHLHLEMVDHITNNSTNSSATDVAIQALSGLPIGLKVEDVLGQRLFYDYVAKRFIDCFQVSLNTDENTQHALTSPDKDVERYSRAFTKTKGDRYYPQSWFPERIKSFAFTSKSLSAIALFASTTNDLTVLELLIDSVPTNLSDLPKDQLVLFVHYARRVSSATHQKEKHLESSMFLQEMLLKFITKESFTRSQFTIQEFLILFYLGNGQRNDLQPLNIDDHVR